jgi:hypothetical protein
LEAFPWRLEAVTHIIAWTYTQMIRRSYKL